MIVHSWLTQVTICCQGQAALSHQPLLLQSLLPQPDERRAHPPLMESEDEDGEIEGMKILSSAGMVRCPEGKHSTQLFEKYEFVIYHAFVTNDLVTPVTPDSGPSRRLAGPAREGRWGGRRFKSTRWRANDKRYY